jgi:hypothetical protein
MFSPIVNSQLARSVRGGNQIDSVDALIPAREFSDGSGATTASAGCAVYLLSYCWSSTMCAPCILAPRYRSETGNEGSSQSGRPSGLERRSSLKSSSSAPARRNSIRCGGPSKIGPRSLKHAPGALALPGRLLPFLSKHKHRGDRSPKQGLRDCECWQPPLDKTPSNGGGLQTIPFSQPREC